MDKRIAAVFVVTLTASALTPFAGAQDTRKSSNAVMITVSEIKWADVPGFPGVQMAVLEGNPDKGAHRSMLKFAGGFAAPSHHHSSDHSGTVVSGTLVLTVDGKATKRPAGSYFSFKNRKPHLTRCETGADCVLSMATLGKWDVVPEKSKTDAKK